MSKITGKATVRVDGEELITNGDATFTPGGQNREAMMGPRGVNGYREESVAPRLEITLHHNDDVDIQALGAITGATVLLETDTGTAWMLRRAFSLEPPELRASEGTVRLLMSGHGVERL